jgi:hypothetical protein
MAHAYIMSLCTAMIGAFLILLQGSAQRWLDFLRFAAIVFTFVCGWHVFNMSFSGGILAGLLIVAVFYRFKLFDWVLSGLLLLAPLAIYHDQSLHLLSGLYCVMALLLMMTASCLYALNANVLKMKHYLILPLSMNQLRHKRVVIEFWGMGLFVLSVGTGYFMAHSQIALAVLWVMFLGGYLFEERRSLFLLLLTLIVWGLHGYF